jgi:hypothetical protein
LAITPDDEIQVTPANATAATGPHPSSNATAAPGKALSRKSTKPETYCVFNVPTRSLAVYSRPSSNSSRITPISAPVATNSSLAANGNNPPWPKASPASR